MNKVNIYQCVTELGKMGVLSVDWSVQHDYMLCETYLQMLWLKNQHTKVTGNGYGNSDVKGNQWRWEMVDSELMDKKWLL